MTEGVTRREWLTRVGAVAAITAAGSLSARAAESSAPIAETTFGRVRGAIDDGILVFKGIPYGGPTGTRRFRPAADPQPWTGVRDALAYGPAAPQMPSALFTDKATSEDCLVLNVWTPALADRGKRPIMVWLHGGGFSTLSGSSPMYDGVNLCKRGDVVVVTLNHRLNVFGFLHLGDLVGGEYAESGNVGMLDIVQALRWVQRNAAAFGGDASNVTIFGESGGGRKVSTLLAMPAAQGLFHRAIIQSGPGLHLQPRDLATAVAEAFLKAMGETPATIARLDTARPEALLKACEFIENGFDQGARSRGRVEQRGFVPTVGTATLPRFAFDPAATEISADVPVMIGTNRHEMALFARGDKEIYDRTLTEDALRGRLGPLVGGATDRVMEVYSRLYPNADPAVRWILMTSDRTYRGDSITLAQRRAALGRGATFMYLFEWRSLADPKLLAHHGLEIAFAFDNATKVTTWSGGGATAAALADKMSEAWLAFARTGNPATPKLPTWPAYTAATRATMRFDDECALANDPDAEVRRLWATI